VIVRAGFDLPLKKHSEGHWGVADDTRVRDVLSTIKYLIAQKAKIIIMSHLGRPEGWDLDKSLWPAAEKLGELLDYKVVKITDHLPNYAIPHVNFLTSDITKHDYADLSHQIKSGEILFLENLRFYPGEMDNDDKFIAKLASFGDVYVEEAFSVAHRKEASTVGLAKKLPAYGGVSLLKEIASLQKIIKHPRSPFVLIMGGIKIEDKVATIHNLAKEAAYIIVGGGIANTFLKAAGFNVGKSKISDVMVAKDLIRNYKAKIVLPIDVVVATSVEAMPRAVNIEHVRSNDIILDVGPKSVRKYAGIIKEAKTLVWNGPFGILENPKYAHGSRAIALMFAMRSKGKAFGMVGGGETIEALHQAKVVEYIDHVSTGGGAMLEFLAGKPLPAIKVLER